MVMLLMLILLIVSKVRVEYHCRLPSGREAKFCSSSIGFLMVEICIDFEYGNVSLFCDKVGIFLKRFCPRLQRLINIEYLNGQASYP